jgi:hypothetical protein
MLEIKKETKKLYIISTQTKRHNIFLKNFNNLKGQNLKKQ